MGRGRHSSGRRRKKKKEGVDYHTFIKIEFILENLKQEKELYQKC